MANYITVDGGTTNTRVSLVSDGKILSTKKFSLGARASIGDNTAQRVAIRDAIGELLDGSGLSAKDITRVLASGMITSEFGLIKLDHISAPAGIRELHEGMYETVLEDITDIPFVFIRGVKLASGVLTESDVMRGEETETVGLSAGGHSVYILPGSHSKIIFTDECERIEKFYTMLTGEMIFALSQSTILKDAVDLTVTDINEQYLLDGYRYAASEGLNEALFKVRILKNMFSAERCEIYSFFLGAVLSGEIKKVLRLAPEKIVIGGKEQIKLATAMILRAETDTDVVLCDKETVEESVVRGAIKIYEFE